MGKICGIRLLQMVKFLRVHGRAAREQLSPALHHYLGTGTMIDVAGWYPETDHEALIEATARLLPQPDLFSTYQWIGRIGARNDLRTYYPDIFVADDPAATLENLTTLWHRHHDSGRLEAVASRDGHGTILVCDFPHLTPVFVDVTSGYLEELVRLANGRHPHAGRVATERPDQQGWRVRWSPA
ncbi:MAG: hypothetical protein AAF772_05965 [Acidobacteriota bacterium]